MSLNKRIEVEQGLINEAQENGAIFLSEKDRVRAIQRHEGSRKAYEDSRRDMLRQELGRFYRVAIFGSARLDANDPEFQFVTELAKALVEARGVDIVSGGGPGLMAAANLGAQLALENSKGKKRLRARSLGITLSTLAHEPKPNEYLHLELRHGEFSTRLQTFIDKTDAAYFAPGGIGTMLEMMMLLQTKQVGHVSADYPLIAHPFWKRTLDDMNDAFYHEREAGGQKTLISPKDLNLVTISNHIPEIVGIVSGSYDNWAKNIRSHVKILP